jgi:hypothetical protein
MLEEIRDKRLLFVRSYSRYGPTARALLSRGLITITEHDYSPMAMQGYSINPSAVLFVAELLERARDRR